MTSPTNDFELDIPLVYMTTTIPAGITIAAYRRSRPARPSLRRRLISRLLAADSRTAPA
jgi:hypothetical protein